MTLTTVRAPRAEKCTSTTLATAAAAFEIALTGVTAVNDLSADVVVRSQPHPLPVPHEIDSKVTRAIRPAPTVWTIRRATDAPGPAQAQPKNRTPSRAGDLTPAATAHRTTPGTVPHRMATASPAMSSPSMSASLCAPPISVIRTNGQPAPRRTAWAGSRPRRRARAGVAATIKARPATSSRRKRTMSGRILCPDALSRAPSMARNVGP